MVKYGMLGCLSKVVIAGSVGVGLGKIWQQSAEITSLRSLLDKSNEEVGELLEKGVRLHEVCELSRRETFTLKSRLLHDCLEFRKKETASADLLEASKVESSRAIFSMKMELLTTSMDRDTVKRSLEDACWQFEGEKAHLLGDNGRLQSEVAFLETAVVEQARWKEAERRRADLLLQCLERKRLFEAAMAVVSCWMMTGSEAQGREKAVLLMQSNQLQDEKVVLENRVAALATRFEAEQAASEAHIAQLQQANGALRTTNQQTTDKLNESEAAAEVLRKELALSREAAAEMHAEKDSMLAAIGEAARKEFQHAAAMAAVVEEASEARKELAIAQACIAQCQAKAAQSERDLAKSRAGAAEVLKEKEALCAKAAALDAELFNCRAAAAEVVKETASLRVANGDAMEKVAVTEAKLVTCRAIAVQLQAENGTLLTIIGEGAEKVARMEAALLAAGIAAEELQAEQTTLLTANGEAAQKIAALETRLVVTAEESQQRQQQHDAALASLQQQLSDKQADITTLKSFCEHHHSKVMMLNKEIAVMKIPTAYDDDRLNDPAWKAYDNYNPADKCGVFFDKGWCQLGNRCCRNHVVNKTLDRHVYSESRKHWIQEAAAKDPTTLTGKRSSRGAPQPSTSPPPPPKRAGCEPDGAQGQGGSGYVNRYVHTSYP